MSARTTLTTAALTNLDLRHPHAADYAGFRWVAEHLAKEKRFNGATPDCEYSVAEHLCRGADAIGTLTGDDELAAYFLLHDAHEAALKDDTTPKKRALAEEAQELFGILADDIMAAFAALTERHDAAIHAAAGLAWPPTPFLRERIKHFDLVMFVTEWRDLMQGTAHPDWDGYAMISPLTGRIEPWSYRTARDGWLRRARKLLPALMAKEHAA